MSENEPVPATPAAPAVPPRRPRWLRAWAWILILLFVVGSALLATVLADGWLRSAVVAGAARAGLELDPASELSVSLLDARIHGRGIRFTALNDPARAEVLRIGELDADLAVLDSLGEGSLVVESLVATGVRGDLRKRGTWQPLPEAEEPSESGKPIDWERYYRLGMEQLKKWAEQRELDRKKAEEEAKLPPEQRPKPPPAVDRPAEDWPKARRFDPPPEVKIRQLPRVVIRRLAISGEAIAIPHDSPLAITGFAVDGAALAIPLRGEEVMRLAGELRTAHTAPASFTLVRSATGAGSLDLAVPGFPLELLADRRLGGERFARYGVGGSATASLRQTWQGWDMQAVVSATIANLRMAPAGADKELKRTAEIVNRIKTPIIWPVRLGGTLYAPTVTDTGFAAAMSGALGGAAKELIGAEAEKQVDKQLDKGLDKLLDKHGDKLGEAGKGLVGGAAATAAAGTKGLLNNILGR
ncbi:MAG: hypothetical protein RLZZ127_1597 [Planctomycetota bacterium]|jgi:hypothetical protein